MNEKSLNIKSWVDIKEKYLDKERRTEIELEAEVIAQLLLARSEVGLSQRELAIKSGVKQPVIARIESQVSSPTLSTLVKLLDALGKKLNIKDI